MLRVFRDFIVLLISNQADVNSDLEPLGGIGFARLDAAFGNKEGLAKVRELKPDLLVVNKIPGDGELDDLITEIRENPATEETPLLIYGDEDDKGPGGLADRLAEAEPLRVASNDLSSGDLARVIADLVQNYVDPEKEEAYRLLDSARQKSAAGSLAEAAKDYTAALTLYNDMFEPILELAALQVKLDRYEEAERSYLRALEINKLKLGLYTDLAVLYQKRGDYQQGIGHSAAGPGHCPSDQGRRQDFFQADRVYRRTGFAAPKGG